MGLQAAVSTQLYMSLNEKYTKTRCALDMTRFRLAEVEAQCNDSAVRLAAAEQTNANVQAELRRSQERVREQELELDSLKKKACTWETNANDVYYESRQKTAIIDRLKSDYEETITCLTETASSFEARLKQAESDHDIFVSDMRTVRRTDKENLQSLQVQYAEASERERVRTAEDFAALRAAYEKENASLRKSLETCESTLAKERVKKSKAERIIQGCKVTLFEARRESREQYATLSRKYERLCHDHHVGTEKSLKRQADLKTEKEAAEVKVQEVEHDMAELREHVRESDLWVLGLWATMGSGCERP